MAKFNPTPEELEEFKHSFLAQSSLDVLIKQGWRLLECDLINDLWHEIRITEAVVRKNDFAFVIRWHPANKGWMRRIPNSGWVIFDPTK